MGGYGGWGGGPMGGYGGWGGGVISLAGQGHHYLFPRISISIDLLLTD